MPGHRAPPTLWIRREGEEIVVGLIGWRRVEEDRFANVRAAARHARFIMRVTDCNLVAMVKFGR